MNYCRTVGWYKELFYPKYSPDTGRILNSYRRLN